MRAKAVRFLTVGDVIGPLMAPLETIPVACLWVFESRLHRRSEIKINGDYL